MNYFDLFSFCFIWYCLHSVLFTFTRFRSKDKPAQILNGIYVLRLIISVAMEIFENFYQWLNLVDGRLVFDRSGPSGTSIWNKSAKVIGKCPFYDQPFYMVPLTKILYPSCRWPLTSSLFRTPVFTWRDLSLPGFAHSTKLLTPSLTAYRSPTSQAFISPNNPS